MDTAVPTCGLCGGVPCLDKWNAFIFASMLCGRFAPLLACAPRILDKFAVGGPGRRAFCNTPSGVEEVVIEGVVVGSDVDRREGIRGVFANSGEGLTAGESSSSSVVEGERGAIAKSMESSGAAGAMVSGAEAMLVEEEESCLARGHEQGGAILDGQILFWSGWEAVQLLHAFSELLGCWQIGPGRN
jgi:hypothetical protein